jgi:hypothetical protein
MQAEQGRAGMKAVQERQAGKCSLSGRAEQAGKVRPQECRKGRARQAGCTQAGQVMQASRARKADRAVQGDRGGRAGRLVMQADRHSVQIRQAFKAGQALRPEL